MSKFPFAVISSPSEIRAFARKHKKDGGRVALVATMGALHGGHLSLLRLARERASSVIVSIYVNPVQFGLHEDFDYYPRQLESDLRLLAGVGIDIAAVYTPHSDIMYPADFASEVRLPRLSRHLCGRARPRYFCGVALVVAKLLHQSEADIAVFGEKDYQQLAVIRQMVLDLDFAVEILAAPIRREADGLAMSSRNVYLDAEQRQKASLLYRVLRDCAEPINAGRRVDSVLAKGRRSLRQGGFDKLDYLALVSGDDLQILHHCRDAARLMVAAHLGSVRLIDNIAIAEAR